MNKRKLKDKLVKAGILATNLMLTVPMEVYATSAETGGGTGGTAAASPIQVILKVVNIFVDLFPAIGIVLLLIGAFKMFMAFRSDNPDGYSSAAKEMIIGVVLIIFKAFAWESIKTSVGV